MLTARRVGPQSAARLVPCSLKIILAATKPVISAPAVAGVSPVRLVRSARDSRPCSYSASRTRIRPSARRLAGDVCGRSASRGTRTRGDGIRLGNGGTIQVNAPKAAENTPYITGVQLNGQPYTSTALPESIVSRGGTRDFSLSSTPDTNWGTGANDAPRSYQTGQDPAIGFTDPSGPLVVIAGDSPNVTVGAQGTGLRDTTVHWSADTGSSGITVAPASGTLSVSADGRASTQATVSVPGSVATGSYPVSFHFTTGDGQTLPTATDTVTVTSPVQPQ